MECFTRTGYCALLSFVIALVGCALPAERSQPTAIAAVSNPRSASLGCQHRAPCPFPNSREDFAGCLLVGRSLGSIPRPGRTVRGATGG